MTHPSNTYRMYTQTAMWKIRMFQSLMSDILLKTEGVSRVHGGGFAGTIQAFVKNDYVET